MQFLVFVGSPSSGFQRWLFSPGSVLGVSLVCPLEVCVSLPIYSPSVHPMLSIDLSIDPSTHLLFLFLPGHLDM